MRQRSLQWPPCPSPTPWALPPNGHCYPPIPPARRPKRSPRWLPHLSHFTGATRRIGHCKGHSLSSHRHRARRHNGHCTPSHPTGATPQWPVPPSPSRVRRHHTHRPLQSHPTVAMFKCQPCPPFHPTGVTPQRPSPLPSYGRHTPTLTIRSIPRHPTPWRDTTPTLSRVRHPHTKNGAKVMVEQSRGGKCERDGSKAFRTTTRRLRARACTRVATFHIWTPLKCSTAAA